jgi:hypothetical protein
MATSPRTIAGPLFVEFRRVAILTLQAPANLKRQILEDAISAAVQNRLTVGGPSANLKWVSRNENEPSWRELELPMLGWVLCYATREGELVLANNSQLLKAVLAANNKRLAASELGSFSALEEMTVIRLDQRKPAFDDIMGKLDAGTIKLRQQARGQRNDGSESQEFFSGSIGSLLGVASSVTRIELRRSSSPGHLNEELDFVFK